MPKPVAHQVPVTEAELVALESAHPQGLTMFQIIGCLSERGLRISEAKFRKYVQLGLLPQSRRTRCGDRKSSGSQGLYPVTAIRYLLEIRARLSSGETLAEIRQDMKVSIAQDGVGTLLAGILRELKQEVSARNDLDLRVHRAHMREIAMLKAKARGLMAHIARVGSALHHPRRIQTRA